MSQLQSQATFHVLSPSQPIHQHYLLEASAGTGKTFSIENLVVRFLLKGNIQINEILVVTFTRAAARELKQRIYQKIQSSLTTLRSLFHQEDVLDDNDPSIPEYLREYTHKEKKEVWEAKLSLERAVADFEGCQIFTIHSFCYRMLMEHVFEGDYAFQASESQLTTIESLLSETYDEWLRLDAVQNALHPIQWRKLFGRFQNDTEKLKQTMIHHGENDTPIVSQKGWLLSGKKYKRR